MGWLNLVISSFYTFISKCRTNHSEYSQNHSWNQFFLNIIIFEILFFNFFIGDISFFDFAKYLISQRNGEEKIKG